MLVSECSWYDYANPPSMPMNLRATWEQCDDCKYCFDCGTHGTCDLPVEQKCWGQGDYTKCSVYDYACSWYDYAPYPAGSCGALEWGADYHNGAKCRHFGRRAFSKKAPELNRMGDRWEICCGEETLSTGALIGLIVGPIVGCCFCTLIVALVVVLLKKNKANNSSTTATANPVAITVEMKAEPAVGVAKKTPISLKLEELGCGQYEAALADQGYDDMASLQGLSKEKAGEIADDVKMKPGHKRRFVDGIAVL